jgi:hypothetical protein
MIKCKYTDHICIRRYIPILLISYGPFFMCSDISLFTVIELSQVAMQNGGNIPWSWRRQKFRHVPLHDDNQD